MYGKKASIDCHAYRYGKQLENRVSEHILQITLNIDIDIDIDIDIVEGMFRKNAH